MTNNKNKTTTPIEGLAGLKANFFNEMLSGFSVSLLVDHSVMENLHHFKHDYEGQGGKVDIIGLDNHQTVSEHPLAARKKRVLEMA